MLEMLTTMLKSLWGLLRLLEQKEGEKSPERIFEQKSPQTRDVKNVKKCKKDTPTNMLQTGEMLNVQNANSLWGVPPPRDIRGEWEG